MDEWVHRRAGRTIGEDPACCPPDDADAGGGFMPRREFLARLSQFGLAAAGLAWLADPAAAQSRRRIRLAFCSQLLCIIPYEVARRQGYYVEEGLDVELVYFRGGSAAMQALVGGAVDYAATSFDVALAAASRGAEIVRFFTTGRLPLFALAVAPHATGVVRALADLRGRTVGVSALGNADHLLAVYLLRRAGVRPEAVQFAVLGPNLFEALRAGHVDAGMVQEPAATLLEQAGGRVLVNLMDLAQARRHLGGPYEFMGVAVRAAEWPERQAEMRALARALGRALRFIHYGTPRLVIDALPAELIAGGDRALLEQVLARHRRSLYPQDGRLDLEAARRVVAVQQQAGQPVTADLARLLNPAIAGAASP
jgi:NitT/TauT family transport system substrate-binding protein